MTRPPLKVHKIFISASDYSTADIYLHQALQTYKNNFAGELQFIPRGPDRQKCGKYTTEKMKTQFPDHLSAVIKSYNLVPYKLPSKDKDISIICCRTQYIPPCNKTPNLTSVSDRVKAKTREASTETDSKQRTLIIYPYRFQMREKQFIEKLKLWRDEPFRGMILIQPQGGHYSVNEKDLPQHIIHICKRLRIKAEISKKNPAIVECNLQELLPKKRSKKKKQKTDDTNQSNPTTTTANGNPDSNLAKTAPNSSVPSDTLPSTELNNPSTLLILNDPDKGKKAYSATDYQALKRDIEIKFSDFPTVVTANEQDDDTAQSTSLVMIVDLEGYSVATGAEYAWDILKWANSYPFLVIHFKIGPPSQISLQQEPKIKKKLISYIRELEKEEGICYSYENPKRNVNLVICRHK